MRLYICKDFQCFVFILYVLHDILCLFVCVCEKAWNNLHIRDVFVINKSCVQ